MCRWIAYSGPPVLHGSLLTRPDHSLIDQSIRAREGNTTNGDGFGVGWYGAPAAEPGVYRDVQPAWNDANLAHLGAHVRSGLFLAHVRAATGTAVQRTNCHPFSWRGWLFQHNGSVPEFARLKRELVLDVEPGLFGHIEGSTDSEVLFYLALTFGLATSPRSALARTIERVERARARHGIAEPLTLTAATADGRRLYAVRYASDGAAPTLYCSRHIHALRLVDGSYEALPEGAIVVASEPLDALTRHWDAVPTSSLVVVEGGTSTVTPL